MAIVNAIVEGNKLHDNAFEDQAVNLDTKDTFEISEDELELSTYDEQQCYCQNQDLQEALLHHTQFEVQDLQASV